MLLGLGGIVDLQREYPDGVKHLGAVRIGRQQTPELDARFFIVLFADQDPGVSQADILGLGIGAQPALQEIQLRRSPGQEFRLEQGGNVPVRAQHQRLVDLAAGAIGIAYGKFRLGSHKTGFRKLGVGLGQLVEQAMHRLFVRIAGKGARQSHQHFAGIRDRHRQFAGEARTQFIDAAAGEEQRRLHLPCRLRLGFEAQPEPDCVQRDVVLARMKGDIRRSARNSRIARAVRQIEKRAGG